MSAFYDFGGSSSANDEQNSLSIFYSLPIMLSSMAKLGSIYTTFIACDGSSTRSRIYFIGGLLLPCVWLFSYANSWRIANFILIGNALFFSVAFIYNYTSGCEEFNNDNDESKPKANATTAFYVALAADLLTYALLAYGLYKFYGPKKEEKKKEQEQEEAAFTGGEMFAGFS